METEVEAANDGIGIINCNWPDIGKSLNLGGDFLDLVIRHLQTELSYSRLDGVPAGKTRGEVDVARQAKVGGVKDFVCAGVVKDSLGVDTGLVGESTETGDGVVEGGVDLDGLGHEILNLLEQVELVLALDVLGGGDNHASHEPSKRGDAVALANAENGGIDVGGTSLEGAVGIGNTAAGIVVEVGLDVAGDNASQGPD